MGRGLLIFVSGLLIIVGLVHKAVSNRIEWMPERTVNYHQEMDARNISNSIMEYGIQEIQNNQNWRTGISQSDFIGADVDLQVFDYNDYQNNDPDIPSDNSVQNWDQYTILLVSTAQTQRAKAITEAAITTTSFSRYAYFTDFEPSNIYFYSSDTFNGPVHTNGQMNISGTPTFNGFVSSPNMWLGDPNSMNNPQFNGGTDFNADSVQMPTASSLQPLKNQAAIGGLTFNTDINVDFKSNGTVDIAQPQGGGWGPANNYDLDLYNGVISSSAKVYAKGTLNGQVTLHSAEEVVITGDLTYLSNPLNNANSTDILGIVSEGDVTVDQDAHTDSGNQDLEIDASIMALGQSFQVENYQWGSPRGTLTLLGGIQQQQRGAVGTFNSNGIRSGYSKSYTYDQRLANIFPPFYPRASTFSQLYWKEKPVEIL